MGLYKTLLLEVSLVFILSGSSIKGQNINFDNWKTQYLSSSICEGLTNQCEKQLQAGETKSSGFNENIREAVKKVHLYTHPIPAFYYVLNKNCESGEKLYSEYRTLLLNAMDIIHTNSPDLWKTSATTYRGINTKDISKYEAARPNDDWTIDGFTSSSIQLNVGLKFAKGNVLIIMTNVEGLYIESFTAVEHEYEVLIKSPSTYKVIEVISDPSKIQNEVGTIWVYAYPKILLKLRMVRAGKRRKRSSSTYTSCDFPSNNVGVSSKFRVVILVFLALVFQIAPFQLYGN